MKRDHAENKLFPFGSALIVSLFLHIASIMVISVLYLFGYIPVMQDLKAEDEPPAEEIMKFTFVDLPRELPEPEKAPETDVLSDRNRTAGGRPAPGAEVQGENRPYSEGETDMLTVMERERGESMDTLSGEQPDIVGTMDHPSDKPGETETGDTVSLTGGNESAFTEEQRKQLQESIEESMENYQPPAGPPSGDQPRFDNRESSLISEDSILSFETKWFDWGPYAKELYWIIRRNWRIPMAARWPLLMKGRSVVRFTLRKDGTVEDVELLDDSGIPSFDDAAIYAIKLSDPLPPMPENFPGEKERITCSFYYNILKGQED